MWKVGQTLQRNDCSRAKKYNKKVETLLAKHNFSFLIWDRSLKFMLQHPTMWFDWKQSKYPSKELLLWCFAQEVDWCLKDCDKQRLQTAVSKNLWKIFAGHTGDWFNVRTASICTTDLWDALKSFILNSLKFKVAPYPIIVSLDTLTSDKPTNAWSFAPLCIVQEKEHNSWPLRPWSSPAWNLRSILKYVKSKTSHIFSNLLKDVFLRSELRS